MNNPPPSVPFKSLVLPAAAMAVIVLLSNILVQHPINAWLTWGAFAYPVTYFVTDVCNRWAGPASARKVAWVGFVTGALLSIGAALHGAEADRALGLRIAGASATAFIVSQLLDVAIFNRLRQQSWWKAPLWGSAIASVIDTVLFFSLAFAGTQIPWAKVAAGDLGVKLVMAVLLLIPFRAVVRRLGALR